MPTLLISYALLKTFKSFLKSIVYLAGKFCLIFLSKNVTSKTFSILENMKRRLNKNLIYFTRVKLLKH